MVSFLCSLQKLLVSYLFAHSEKRRSSSVLAALNSQMFSRSGVTSLVPSSTFQVPSRTNKDEQYRDFHPRHQADRRGQATVHKPILGLPNVNSKQRIDAPPQYCCGGRSGQNGAPGRCTWSRNAINQGQDKHCQDHRQDWKHDDEKVTNQRKVTKFGSNPWPAKDPQRSGNEPCHTCQGKQEQTTNLAAEKGMCGVVAINQLDAFDDELYRLRANEQRSDPADKRQV